MLARGKAMELIVPGIVLVGCLFYWLHIQDARSVAQRVPLGVIAFTVATTVLVLFRVLFETVPDDKDGSAPPAPPTDRRALVQRAMFVVLCGGYFIALGQLGFNLANLAFLFLAYPLAGLGLVWSCVAAVTSVAVFHVLAQIMKFNVPTGPFGF